jgi:hypothetical protein
LNEETAVKKLRRNFISASDPSTSHAARQFVSPDATIAELEGKAAECERRAEKAEEPFASKLREEASSYRKWIASLRSGRWKA